MFTGIVEKIGIISKVENRSKNTVLSIRCPFSNLKIGSSLAVNGVCLTVVKKKGLNYSFNLLNETKKRSNLAALKAGSVVNLERPLKASGRLEGHFVLGHVDGMGKVLHVISKGKEKSFVIAYPSGLRPYLFEKGSVGVDGVSLTLGKVTPKSFLIHCIPHTLKSTILRHFKTGTIVNLESDILLKLARKILK